MYFEVSQEIFLLFKRGLKSYFKQTIPDGHKIVCRDSGFRIRFSCDFCSQFNLFLYRERLQNGGKYVLSKKGRSCVHNESNDNNVLTPSDDHDPPHDGSEYDRSSLITSVSSTHHENMVFTSTFRGFFERLKEFNFL